MRLPRRLLAAFALPFALLSAAPAAAITQDSPEHIERFLKFTNDGVWTLSADQAAAFGAPQADRIGFLRLRTQGVDWSVGDWFDAETIRASTRDEDAILGLFNGTADASQIAYAGGAMDPLGRTAFATERDVRDAVAFVFDSAAGRIVFTGRGTTSFDGRRTRGAYDGLLPTAPSLPLDDGRATVVDGVSAVPLPAGAWLLISGFAAMAGLGLRRRAG